jgi:soluble lytic murein transglycosylase-like protein
MPPDSSHRRLPPAAPDRRRRRLLAALAAPALAALPLRARAGAQIYEPMADAVRAALAARIADSSPPQRRIEDIGERIEFIDWLNEMSSRLLRQKQDYRERVEFLRTLDYEAIRAGLDRQLVLGLIQVESNFRKYAVSSAGARGYMQVMPFWTSVIGDGDPRALFDMRTNLRYGCVILRHYLDLEQGDLFMALGRYNGSRGREAYPNAVLAAWQGRWAFKPRKPATA